MKGGTVRMGTTLPLAQPSFGNGLRWFGYGGRRARGRSRGAPIQALQKVGRHAWRWGRFAVGVLCLGPRR
eukprot:11154997-Lingulodinium_polyedra.AAC.1